MIPLQAFPDGKTKVGTPLYFIGYHYADDIPPVRDLRFSPRLDAWEANWLLHNMNREGEWAIPLPESALTRRNPAGAWS